MASAGCPKAVSPKSCTKARWCEPAPTPGRPNLKSACTGRSSNAARQPSSCGPISATSRSSREPRFCRRCSRRARLYHSCALTIAHDKRKPMVQKTRRRVLVAGALAAAGLTVAKIAEAIPTGKLTIALVLKSLADPFTVAMASAAQNYQKHFASQFDLNVLGTSTELDTATQIRMVDDLIGAHTS